MRTNQNDAYRYSKKLENIKSETWELVWSFGIEKRQQGSATLTEEFSTQRTVTNYILIQDEHHDENDGTVCGGGTSGDDAEPHRGTLPAHTCGRHAS
ncbi:hypothetical protein FHG87_005350 [Trinorchestia longiramus]|nr:hypothetical protein FHG87_005350 [Trinorchestia longiramus]